MGSVLKKPENPLFILAVDMEVEKVGSQKIEKFRVGQIGENRDRSYIVWKNGQKFEQYFIN